MVDSTFFGQNRSESPANLLSAGVLQYGLRDYLALRRGYRKISHSDKDVDRGGHDGKANHKRDPAERIDRNCERPRRTPPPASRTWAYDRMGGRSILMPSSDRLNGYRVVVPRSRESAGAANDCVTAPARTAFRSRARRRGLCGHSAPRRARGSRPRVPQVFGLGSRGRTCRRMRSARG